MSYWAAAQLQPQRDGLAVHCLQQAGFEIYAPRLRQQRDSHGRRITATPLLFPCYLFVRVVLQWHTARWAPGVVRLIMDGVSPAVVPHTILADLKARERGGLIELPKPPRFRHGERVRVLHGPFADHVALYDGMSGEQRVYVLLQWLGACRRVAMPLAAIERVAR